jgi:iron-sulfur cluster repair protein YtfE (RIC family)
MIHIGKSAGADTPAGLLLDCHARIRRFGALAVRLAEESAPEAEVGEAAAAVHRYFTRALPLHVADEEQSLAPRLRRFAPDTLDALATMEREHREHAALLARLVPEWEKLARSPAGRGATLADAQRLLAALEAHLAAEESAVIPSLSRVPPAEAQAFAGEMRARRV